MTSRDGGDGDRTNVRFKHLACNTCRKRKLRCSGQRPICSTCDRSGRDCEWEDTVRKTGPRRGYVRSLEARLAEVEALLGRQHKAGSASTHSPQGPPTAPATATSLDMNGEEWPATTNPLDHAFPPPFGRHDSLASPPPSAVPDMLATTSSYHPPQSDHSSQSAYATSSMNNAAWELNAVGLQEPLPSQSAIDDLHDLFFEKVYPRLPIVHKGRYLAAMSLPSTSRLRPPVCLSYAMWCLAAARSDNYDAVTEHFYHRARKYMDLDEIEGRGQHVVTLAHAQATVCLATYEMQKMYFPRAWLNVGRAVRLCHMMNLHRLDGTGLDVRETLSSPSTWLELEERRRVFWAVFIQDRYQSIGSGWPMIIDERDITTHLPANEQEFTAGQPTGASLTSKDAMTPTGVKRLTMFAASAVIATLFGRTLNHLHRQDVHEDLGDGIPAVGDDADVAFWRRHRYLDNILLNTLQFLPVHLQIRQGIFNPQIVMLHVNIQASTICLHQAAVFKATSSTKSENFLPESKARCLSATENMLTILRLVNPVVMEHIGPWLPFCLYLAARVLVQTLSEPEQSPDSHKHLESLNLLMGILKSMKAKSPYTASLLMQLGRDIDAFGKLNPIGHIVVPMSQITESLEQDKAAEAFTMNATVPSTGPLRWAFSDAEPVPHVGNMTAGPSTNHSDPELSQAYGARPTQTLLRAHSDPFSTTGGR